MAISKINGLPRDSTQRGCQVNLETSELLEPVDVVLKSAEVRNYNDVMINAFEVPAAIFFNGIPMNLNHLRRFITDNDPSTEVVRIYLAKKTRDTSVSDFEIIFVPCITKSDEEGTFFEDNLGENGNAFLVADACRKPPGCPKGARLG